MDRFSGFNPKATLLYFLLVIVGTLLLFNPIYLGISLVFAFLYRIKLTGYKSALRTLGIIPVLIALTSVFNMIFADYGMTVLFTLGNNSFTLESLAYGFTQGLLVSGVLLWFSCYNEIVTGEMLLSVFGGFMPGTAMLFSMTLAFIPRLMRNAREINDAREQFEKGRSKLTHSVKNLSALVTLTLEESIERSDSMRARGYNSRRRPYSKYRFSHRDLLLVISELMLFAFVLFVRLSRGAVFAFDPKIYVAEQSPLYIIIFTVFTALPLIIDFTEDLKWKLLRRKL